MRSPPFPLRHLGTQVQHVAQPAERAEGGREEGSAMQCTLSHVARPATHKPAGRSLSGFFDGGTSFLYQWEGAMDAISEEASKESV